jgi:hypothetical protein
MQAWADWNARFNADIDALHGAGFQGDVFPSPFAPTNAVDEGGWLPFTLTEREIAALVAEAPAELRAKLDTSSPSTLKSLSFEFSSATIVRPWFSPDVFRARFWRLPDGAPPICDGATPPSGVCPAYVTAVVFARHVREEHKTGAPAGTRFDGFKFVAGRAATFEHVSATTVVRDHRAAPTLGRRRTDAARFRAAAVVSPGPAVAEARVLRRAAVVASPSPVAVAATPAPIAATPASAAKLRALRDMSFTRLAIATQTATPTAPSPPSDDIYVFAFICKRVGKCPDPDPALTW